MLARCQLRVPCPSVSCQSARQIQTPRRTHIIAVSASVHCPDDTTSSAAQLDRRSFLTAAAASMLAAASPMLPLPAAAEEAVMDTPAVKQLKGKAGFRFSYPDGWVTGFVSFRHISRIDPSRLRRLTTRFAHFAAMRFTVAPSAADHWLCHLKPLSNVWRQSHFGRIGETSRGRSRSWATSKTSTPPACSRPTCRASSCRLIQARRVSAFGFSQRRLAGLPYSVASSVKWTSCQG